MKVIKFLLIAVVAWFLAAFGFGAAAAALQVPDTDPWMWIIRVSALVIATCVAWLVVGAAQAREICRVIVPIIGAITNLIYVVCFILGATAVVMLFVRDWAWLYEHLYARLIMPSIGISLFTIVPMTLLLMMFAKTRTLGGLVLYLLSSFFGFTLWLYSLIIAGFPWARLGHRRHIIDRARCNSHSNRCVGAFGGMAYCRKHCCDCRSHPCCSRNWVDSGRETV
jgi:MFS family permease